MHDAYALGDGDCRKALDLGCGPNPSNRFRASDSWGVDLYEDLNRNVLRCRLGFEPLPFATESLDYLTAYDLLEHILATQSCRSMASNGNDEIAVKVRATTTNPSD